MRAGLDGHASQEADLFLGRPLDTDGVQLGLVHGGQDRDGEELAVRQGDIGRLAGSGDHLGTTGGVEGEEGTGTTLEALHRRGDGVGNVMQLEVEEDLEAQGMEFVDDARTMTREELQAEFHPGEVAGQGASQGQGFLLRFDVEGEDQAATGGHAVGLGAEGRGRKLR